jgi:hypothetical protein
MDLHRWFSSGHTVSKYLWRLPVRSRGLHGDYLVLSNEGGG